MRLKKVTNISNIGVNINLEDGNSIYLPPQGLAENINVTDISGVRRFLKVVEDLGEPRIFQPSRIQLRD